MLHRWRTAPLAGALVLLCAVLAMSSLAAPATAAGELETRTITSYDVGADGGVHVTLTAQVINRDPSTQRRDSGRVFYYSATALAVHEGATNVIARTGPTRLVTDNVADARDSGDPFHLVVVRFGRDLYFNESVEFALEYDLSSVRGAQVLVNREYAFVTAIGQGTQSLVRITAPPDREVTIGSANCARTADRPVTYLCGMSTAPGDYQTNGRCAFSVTSPRWDCAFTGNEFVAVPFEARSPGLTLASQSSQVQLAKTLVRVQIHYFAGDEAWAVRVDDLIRRGLPLLEEANGFAYPGLATIEITQSGYRDTHGYEGLANTQGRIRLTPVVDDQTVLHEVSHLWSGIFTSRWLAEGMADYTANVAARRLGLRGESSTEPADASPPLEEWGSLRSQIAVTRQERDAEEAGYSRSLYFIERLAAEVGPGMIAAANATLAQERIAGTGRSYLDVLEQLTGQDLAPLFSRWVLTETDAARLAARTASRERVAELKAQASAAGLVVPVDIQRALLDWDFDRADRLVEIAGAALAQHLESLDRAQARGYDVGQRFGLVFAEDVAAAAALAQSEAAAVAAVQSSEARVAEARTPLMRIGLLGSDVDATLEDARAALAAGEFQPAIEWAESAQRHLDRSTREGIIRLGLLVGFAVLVASMILLRGRSRNHSQRNVNAWDSTR
jgi:hypothetical protein